MNAFEIARTIRDAAPDLRPSVGIVLGSGLGGLTDCVRHAVSIPYVDLPSFPHAGVSGHHGALILGRIAGLDVALLAGRAHTYETGNPRAMAVPIATLAALGVETLILTNAAGSLREEVGPGRVVAISDHIAFGPNPLVGVEGDGRFVSMVDAYDPTLRACAHDAAAEAGIELGEGVYMWFCGPSFETPAEIRMARTLGADMVGMSTVPETILARHAGLRVLGLSTVTNFAAGMSARPLSHAETKAEAAKAAADLEALIVGIAARLAREVSERAPDA